MQYTTPFVSYVLSGNDANGDGKWDITISSGYIWVVNGIDIAAGPSTNLPSSPQRAAAGPGVLSGNVLTTSELAPVVSAAVARLTSAGHLSPSQVTQLLSVRFVIGDLRSAGELGEHTGGLVTLDATAGGRGWFIDSTPFDDSEFSPTSATQGVGRGTAGKGVDLLTVVMHELSHELGATDLNAGVVGDSLMSETLGAGVRRLPTGGSWALSVDVPVADVVNRVSPYLWLDAETPTLALTDERPVAALGRSEQVWADVPVLAGVSVGTSGTGRAAVPVLAGVSVGTSGTGRSAVPVLHPDWFGNDEIGGIEVG